MNYEYYIILLYYAIMLKRGTRSVGVGVETMRRFKAAAYSQPVGGAGRVGQSSTAIATSTGVEVVQQ